MNLVNLLDVLKKLRSQDGSSSLISISVGTWEVSFDERDNTGLW